MPQADQESGSQEARFNAAVAMTMLPDLDGSGLAGDSSASFLSGSGGNSSLLSSTACSTSAQSTDMGSGTNTRQPVAQASSPMTTKKRKVSAAMVLFIMKLFFFVCFGESSTCACVSLEPTAPRFLGCVSSV